MRRAFVVAALAGSLIALPALAQVATPGGFARSGAAGPMTSGGGRGDFRAGGAGRIPYARPVPGGITRPVPPPGYGRRWHGHRPGWHGGGPGWGGPRPPGRDYVYDRPWRGYPYDASPSGGFSVRIGPRY